MNRPSTPRMEDVSQAMLRCFSHGQRIYAMCVCACIHTPHAFPLAFVDLTAGPNLVCLLGSSVPFNSSCHSRDSSISKGPSRLIYLATGKKFRVQVMAKLLSETSAFEWLQSLGRRCLAFWQQYMSSIACFAMVWCVILPSLGNGMSGIHGGRQ